MNPYRPPLEEIQFVIEQVLQAPARWAEMPAFQETDAALAREVLLQGGRFAQDVLAPLNGSGDLEGCRWSPEGVTTPAGFPQAWKSFAEGGWSAMACAADSGGQGLPQLLNAALDEMLVSANHAWTMYAGLLHGAHDVLRAHATPALRDRYLARIVSGEWLATMNLTEPQAGSDLGLLRSRAEPLSPGPVRNGDAVRVTGQKIFISGGDQDMTDNIVHLVLARLPAAPAGTKGLSLFLVPKVLPDGERNTVYCDGIEKKMGLKGSATCQMRFEGAQGWLLGEPHAGLGAMFLMMNAARLHVAVQGLGHLEAATQKAHHYALDRVQMRAPSQPDTAPAEARSADPIAWHPAVRRTVLTLAAQTSASRVIAYWTASLLDEHHQHAEPQRRADAGELVALLTPVVKGFLTDIGHRGTDDALGVLGGYGYIHEYGIEQQVRDSRIAMIYEGTNEVQAIDLVLRKLLGKGRGLALLLKEFRQTAQRCQTASVAAEQAGEGDAAQTLHRLALAVDAQAQETEQAARTLAEARSADAEGPFRVADDALHAVGHALLAWAWARIALAAVTLAPAESQRERLDLCAFGVDWLLPAGQWRWRRISSWRTPLPWISGSAVHGG